MIAIFVANDTIPEDTTLVAEDSLTQDVLVTYEIPEIITYDRTITSIQRIFFNYSPIAPQLTDVTIRDAFFYSPYIVMQYGMGQPEFISLQGQDAKRTCVQFNNHPLNHPIFGTTNLHMMPIQFTRSIEFGFDGYGRSAIKIDPNINEYDRPYSTTGLITGDFGHTGYLFELTRAIDNNFGFYLDGVYRQANGYQVNDGFTTEALFANFYDNHILPMRLDVLFNNHDFGFANSVGDTVSSAQQQLLDIGYTLGTRSHGLSFFFSQYRDAWQDNLQHDSLEQTVRQYYLETDNCHNFGMFELLYRITGTRHEFVSELYDINTMHSLGLNTTINLHYQRFMASLSNSGEIAADETFYHTPFGAIGYAVFDSSIMYAAVSHEHRSPLPGEYAPLLDTLFTLPLTNDSLTTEYYWSYELGLRDQHSMVSFFRYTYKDPITTLIDSSGQLSYQNIESRTLMGLNWSILLPIDLYRNTAKNANTQFVFGSHGMGMYEWDTLFTGPRNLVRGHIGFKRQTPRFGLDLEFHGTYMGPRNTIDNQKLDPYSLFGFSGEIRFVSLTFAARVDNIFDITHYYTSADFPLASRSFTLYVQWQFWY